MPEQTKHLQANELKQWEPLHLHSLPEILLRSHRYRNRSRYGCAADVCEANIVYSTFKMEEKVLTSFCLF